MRQDQEQNAIVQRTTAPCRHLRSLNQVKSPAKVSIFYASCLVDEKTQANAYRNEFLRVDLHEE